MTVPVRSLILKCERRVTVQNSTHGGTEMLFSEKPTVLKNPVLKNPVLKNPVPKNPVPKNPVPKNPVPKNPVPKNPARFGRAMRTLVAGCAAGSLMLGVQAFSGEMAEAASATMVLHYYQVQTDLTFFNASNVAIHHYPPLGGHVKEDDVDYVGSQASHGATSTVSDHLFCTVVSMPANARCFAVFAAGDGLIYADNFATNLAANNGTIRVDGGTGRFAGYTGSLTDTTIGNTNNSVVVITLSK
jgi:hypothetical protein